jgi:hypothetical protein
VRLISLLPRIWIVEADAEARVFEEKIADEQEDGRQDAEDREDAEGEADSAPPGTEQRVAPDGYAAARTEKDAVFLIGEEVRIVVGVVLGILSFPGTTARRRVCKVSLSGNLARRAFGCARGGSRTSGNFGTVKVLQVVVIRECCHSVIGGSGFRHARARS